jgi:hypothetical protein
VFYVLVGQRGSEHVKHAQMGVFYVYEREEMGKRGDEHIKPAQTGGFYVLEGRGGSVGRRTRKTRPDGRVLRV